MALGNLRNPGEVIGLLSALPRATVATDHEILWLIDHEALRGTGVGYVDAQLLAAARLSPGARVWTRDVPLARVAARLGCGFDQVAG